MPNFYRRASIYAAAIGVPAFFLVGTGLYASYANSQTIVRLERVRLELALQQLAKEWEDSVLEQAQVCLREFSTAETKPRSCSLASAMYRFRGTELTFPENSDALGRRAAQEIATRSTLLPGHVYPLAFNTPPYAQVFYMGWFEEGSPPNIVALSVDLDKVRSGLFGFEGRQRSAGVNARLVTATSPRAAGDIAVFLGSLFPFWRISASPPPDPVPVHMLLAAGIALFAGGILGISAIWLARHSSDREAFLSGATHGLKLPLANIRLYADILKERHGDSCESSFQFDTIIYQSEALSRRIDNVLAATQIGIAGRRYEVQLRSLVDVVRNTIRICEGWATHEGFQLQSEFPEEDVECEIDGDAVSSALVSLVENAIKYSHAPSIIRVGVGKENNRAIVEVTDHGIGIPRNEQTRIFQRFRRGTARAEKGGFGLGLFLVDHIVRQHGGSIRLFSTPATGSTFQLIFPLCKRS